MSRDNALASDLVQAGIRTVRSDVFFDADSESPPMT